MKVFKLFAGLAPDRVFISILLGLVSGSLATLLVPLLIKSVSVDYAGLPYLDSERLLVFNVEILNFRFAYLFLACVLVVVIARAISNIILTRVSIDLASSLRVEIYGVLKRSSILAIDNIGHSKIISVLNTDVPAVVAAAQLFPQILSSCVMIATFMLVISFINLTVFKFTLLIVSFGFATSFALRYISQKYLRISREYVDEMYESVKGLVYGIKELRINESKFADYFGTELLGSNDNYVNTQKRARTIGAITASYGRLIYYFSVGAVAFVFGSLETITTEETLVIIMVMLLLQMPVMTLLGFILQFINAKVSIAKINDLKSALKEEDISDEVEEVGNWNSIRYQSVGFKYKSRSMLEEVTFEVGPIDFEIFKGEVTFITGGNGSGKSTLGKLISLHYLADYGSIYFGETKVKRGNFKSFRQNVCAIFSDYHLFDRLLASDCKEKTVAKVNEYLSMLKLEEKVTFNGGQFSSVSALSSGQKRRLSLLVALIEDKDLYLFDEWAADQDPQFRNIFYTEILQRLKQEGKAVIVITHDDRYFSLADNLIVMENGVIRSGNRKQADGKKTLKGASALVSSI